MAQGPVAVEIEIPVPWGHIAGKAWGNKNNFPVILIHGSMDNSGAFDRLIPILPNNYYYLAIDLPGNGKSSHLPKGFPYHFVDMLYQVKLIINYFQFKRVIFLSHSFGGFVSSFFTAMYPNLIEKLILIDIIAPRRVDPQYSLDYFKARYNIVDTTDKFDPSKKPAYSKEEALKRIKGGRECTLCDEAINNLAERSLVKVNNSNKYSFSHDPTLRSTLHPSVPLPILYSVYSKIKCPVLIVLSNDSKQLAKAEHAAEILRIFQNNSRFFLFKMVPGNHDIHMNTPENLVEPISNFLKHSTKCWGNSNGEPLLGVHGLQDNAATFDRLAPLLPSNVYFVSIDLPGHGLSSHIPAGTFYYFYDLVHSIKRIIDYLKWDKFNYLGHSFGGQIGTYFAAIYPDRIKKLILLDSLRPRPMSEKRFLPMLLTMHEKLHEVEKKLSNGKTPVYSYKEAKERLFNSRFSELTSEAADILLARSLKKNNGGYSFRVDQRLKFPFYPPQTASQQMSILSNIKCELLLIKALESLPMYSFKGVPQVLNMYRRNCPIFKEKIVHGNHDVHNNDPTKVDKIISKFLNYKKSKL